MTKTPLQKDKPNPRKPKQIQFSLSLPHEIAFDTSECQTEVRERGVSK